MSEILVESENRIFFVSDDSQKFIFEKTNMNNSSLLFYLLTTNSNFHFVEKNKYNSIFSKAGDFLYVMLKIRIAEKDRCITIDDLHDISSIKLPNSLYVYKDYIALWNKKIKYMNKFLKSKYEKEYFDFSYYIYLGNIALNIIKNVNFNNITYGFCFNRFDKINTLYLIYDPFNIEIGPIMNSFSEYIKYCIINKIEDERIIFTIKKEYTNDDILLLIGRLLFPTYYYDLFINDRVDEIKYCEIVNRQYKLFKYIESLIEEIKKRYIIKDIPLIEKLINQL